MGEKPNIVMIDEFSTGSESGDRSGRVHDVLGKVLLIDQVFVRQRRLLLLAIFPLADHSHSTASSLSQAPRL